jgi:predicted phosphodiesterase
MEFLIIKRSLLITAMALFAAACSEQAEFINSSESVDMRYNESRELEKKQAPNDIFVDSDDYTIMVMGDSHVGGTINLDKFFKKAGEKNPAAVIMDGDLTGGLSKDYNTFQAHIPDNDSLKLFFVVGNHDLWYNGWGEYYSRFGSSTYYFTITTPVASDLYICLDTGGSTLGHLQTEWLKTVLKTIRPDYRRCIVITHVNLFRPRHTASTNLVVEELYSLVEMFTENHVDMVITGHDHKKDAEVFGLTTYIQIDALEDGLSYAGYMNLRVRNGITGYDFLSINE